MAATYRIYGPLRWSSQSGNAILALQNANGSNKKITINNFEIQPVARNPATAGFQNVKCRLVRCSAMGDGGSVLVPVKMDTTDSLPSQISIYSEPFVTETGTFKEVLVTKARNEAVALNRLAQHINTGRFNRRNNAILSGNATPVEHITLNEGEGFAIVNPHVDRGVPLRVEVTFRIGTNTFKTTHIANANRESNGIYGLFNGVGSGVDVLITEVSLSEIGDSTTPYFQIVPIGSIAPERLDDADDQIDILKYDTNSPTLTSSQLIAVSDAPILPAAGIPQVAMSDASAGSPKGVNYLNTKDFLGPVYRVFFAETTGCALNARSDDMAWTTRHKGSRIIDQFSKIVLRPSDAVALVSSAELATGTTAVSQSGYAPYLFAADITVEDLITPTLEFTGLPSGARVCIVEAGTETLVNIGNESGGTFTYSGFTAAAGTYFDARILCAGYVFQQISNIEKLSEVQTFSIDLTADLVYDALLTEGVTFDGATKRIICDSGNTSLSVPAVYTEWVDWALSANNLRYRHAFENQGGAVIDAGAGTSIPKYCYLTNSWRLRPQESDHTLNVTGGVLLVSGGGDPFANTLSPYTVRINYSQPVQAISVSTSGGGGGASAADIWDYATRTLTSGSAPSAGTVADAVRTELAPELALIDVAVSTRLADADYVEPDNAGIDEAKKKAALAAALSA